MDGGTVNNEKSRLEESSEAPEETSRNLYAEVNQSRLSRTGSEQQGAEQQGSEQQGSEQQGAEQQGSERQGAEQQSTRNQALGLPSLFITSDLKQEKQALAQESNTDTADGANKKDGADSSKTNVDQTEPADTRGYGKHYFSPERRVVGQGEDHSGRHWESYDRALDILRQEGLTHVSLEQLPRSLNQMVQDYADAKERYKNGDPENLADNAREVQELRQRILDALREQTFGNSMPHEELMDMIDMAHERGVQVVGLASEHERDLNQLLELAHNNGEVAGAILNFFGDTSSPTGRAEARRLLEARLTKEYGATRATEILEWMSRMRKAGEIGAPSSLQEFGEMGNNWRDRVFAGEVARLANDSGNRIFVFAGMGHLRPGGQSMRDNLESMGIHMGYRRSGVPLRPPLVLDR